jgi:hypothetical protein
VTQVLVALNKALEISLSNVPFLPGRTLVALDDSGSMTSQMGKGGETPQTIGSVFAAIMFKKMQADVLMFSDDARYQRGLNPMDSIGTIAGTLMERAQASGTNFHSIFEVANGAYDRIFILSDEQGWMSLQNPPPTFRRGYYDRPSANPQPTLARYKQKYMCNPRIYSWHLVEYGTMMFPEQNVTLLAGFSEKVFDLIKLCEEGQDALVNKIKEVQL